MTILLHIIAVIGYATAAWRGIAVAYYVALLFHAATLVAHYHANAPKAANVAIVLSLFMFFSALIGWRLTRPGIARILLSLFALAGMLSPLFLGIDKPLPGGSNLFHSLLGMLAYVFSLISFLQWVDLYCSERAWRKSPTMFGEDFSSPEEAPSNLRQEGSESLLGLEKKCFLTLSVSFVLLMLALISGGIAMMLDGDSPFVLTHKNLFAVITWFFFLILLAGRRLYGWRGRVALAWLAAGFFFLFISYFGSQFVLQVLLERV